MYNVLGGSITALHVIHPPDVLVGGHAQGTGTGFAVDFEEVETTAKSLLTEMEELADAKGVSIETAIVRGHVEHQINRYAEENSFDVIGIGSHGREGFSWITLGSVAEKVVRRAPAPVLVVR